VRTSQISISQRGRGYNTPLSCAHQDSELLGCISYKLQDQCRKYKYLNINENLIYNDRSSNFKHKATKIPLNFIKPEEHCYMLVDRKSG
jgi:hypothetical protein